jgi:hypothetical protein
MVHVGQKVPMHPLGRGNRAAPYPPVRATCHDGFMADEDTTEEIKVPMVWVGLEELPVLAANQVLVQIDQDQLYLTLGVAISPPLVGSDRDELRMQAEQIKYVAARAVSRVAISRRHLGELIDVLQRSAANFDKQGEVR